MGLLIDPNTPHSAVELVEAAAALAGVSLVIAQSEKGIISQLSTLERVRVLTSPTEELYRAAHEHHVMLIQEPLSADGRLEMRFYLREQAVSETRHRYGNLIQ